MHGAQCQEFLSIAKDKFLDQVVTEPKRITETSSTTLELFFTNNTTLVYQVHVIPGISDHEAVFIESSLRPMRNRPAPRKIFQYRKADYKGFKRELHDFTPDFLQKATSPNSNINSLWTDFKCKIHELMEKYIPHS